MILLSFRLTQGVNCRKKKKLRDFKILVCLPKVFRNNFPNNNNKITRGSQYGWVRSTNEPMGQEIFLLNKGILGMLNPNGRR
jgi:hypothetical protein